MEKIELIREITSGKYIKSTNWSSWPIFLN